MLSQHGLGAQTSRAEGAETSLPAGLKSERLSKALKEDKALRKARYLRIQSRERKFVIGLGRIGGFVCFLGLGCELIGQRHAAVIALQASFALFVLVLISSYSFYRFMRKYEPVRKEIERDVRRTVRKNLIGIPIKSRLRHGRVKSAGKGSSLSGEA